MKQYSKYIIILSVLIIGLIIVQLFKEEEINWSYSFSKDHKIPYGNFVLFDQLPVVFQDNNIRVSYYPVYNTLTDTFYFYKNYIFINNYLNFDELDTEELLDYVYDGGNAFISAERIVGSLSDSLEIFTRSYLFNKDSMQIDFSDENLNSNKTSGISKIIASGYLTMYDTSSTTVLAVEEDSFAVFIKTEYGNGNFYINTIPLVFTNFYILDNERYKLPFKMLSYLPAEDTFWDEYYKAGNPRSGSPLRFVLSNQSLSYAYYMLIFSILIYIIFEWKRKQRIIPIIKPLRNTTLDFARTIGDLYYQQKDHKNIADKKINFFYEYLRNRYNLKAADFDEDIIKKLSTKTSVDKYDIQNLFNYFQTINKKIKVTRVELFKLNSLIENFHKQSK